MEDSASAPESARGRLFVILSTTAFWFTVFLVVSLGSLYVVVSDRTALGELITIWPPLLWCFGLIPLAALSLRLWRPRRFLTLLALIAAFLLITSEWRSLLRWPDRDRQARHESLRETSSAGGGEVALRVVSWNIGGGGAGKATLLGALEALGPDLCFLQETPDGRGSLQDEDLVGSWEGFHWVDAGDCGLLSRFPLEPVDADRVGPWTPPQVLIATLPGDRDLLLVNVRLMLPSLRFRVLSSHGRAEIREAHRRRTAQFPNLAALIERLSQAHDEPPVILAGDFNTPGRMASLDPLRSSLRDVWPLCGSGWGATMTAQFPVARIDQCWVSGDIEPIAARVVPTELSDHRILVVDLILPASEN